MGIFDSMDVLTNNNRVFWAKVDLSLFNLGEKILYQSLATIKTGSSTFKTRNLMIVNSTLYFCGKSNDKIKRKSNISWKTVRAFEEQSEKNKQDKRFIIQIGSIVCEEFFFYNPEIFENWLECIGRVAIMTDFQSQYTLVKKIGSGSFSNVYLATELSSLKDYAVKNAYKEKILGSLRGVTSIINEIQIMRQMDHPGIVKLHKVFENDEAILLILDYLPGGSLVQRMAVEKKMIEAKAKKLTNNLLNICCYLHKFSIVHRDLKLDNILFSSVENEDQIKLVDFGLSCYLSETHSLRCGSPGYIAPEILSNNAFNEKSDLFSIGIIIYILICGHSPYSGSSTSEILKKNRLGQIYFIETEWLGVSQGCIDLILELTKADPNMRPSAAEALMHPWLNSKKPTYIFMPYKEKIIFPSNSTGKKISSRLMERFQSNKRIERPENKKEIKVDETRAIKITEMLRKTENN